MCMISWTCQKGSTWFIACPKHATDPRKTLATLCKLGSRQPGPQWPDSPPETLVQIFCWHFQSGIPTPANPKPIPGPVPMITTMEVWKVEDEEQKGNGTRRATSPSVKPSPRLYLVTLRSAGCFPCLVASVPFSLMGGVSSCATGPLPDSLMGSFFAPPGVLSSHTMSGFFSFINASLWACLQRVTFATKGHLPNHKNHRLTWPLESYFHHRPWEVLCRCWWPPSKPTEGLRRHHLHSRGGAVLSSSILFHNASEFGS